MARKAKRKECRPGYTRIALDLPTPLYERLRSFVDTLRDQWGASEQAVCRRFIDEGLTRAGYPPTQRDATRKAKPKP